VDVHSNVDPPTVTETRKYVMRRPNGSIIGCIVVMVRSHPPPAARLAVKELAALYHALA